jgi:hypothetical protein
MTRLARGWLSTRSCLPDTRALPQRNWKQSQPLRQVPLCSPPPTPGKNEPPNSLKHFKEIRSGSPLMRSAKLARGGCTSDFDRSSTSFQNHIPQAYLAQPGRRPIPNSSFQQPKQFQQTTQQPTVLVSARFTESIQTVPAVPTPSRSVDSPSQCQVRTIHPKDSSHSPNSIQVQQQSQSVPGPQDPSLLRTVPEVPTPSRSVASPSQCQVRTIHPQDSSHSPNSIQVHQQSQSVPGPHDPSRTVPAIPTPSRSIKATTQSAGTIQAAYLVPSRTGPPAQHSRHHSE